MTGWLRRRQNALIALVAVAVSGALVLSATNAAFTATTTNPGNAFAAGTVALSDDDAGNALFTLSNLKPGDSTTQCITVTYTGTLGAQLRMYAATTGTGLGADLNLKLTRGGFATPPGNGDCTGFTADTTDYISHGAGVLYDAALSSFAGTWGAGTVDRSASTPATAEVWTTNEKHAYQLTITLPSGTANTEQGKTASTTVTWETRDASDAGAGSYYANAVLADNPVSFWRLNETSGATATDLGSGHHDGTYQNGTALNAPGPLQDAQSAARFDGSDDAVGAGNVDGFSGTSSFSVEVWARRTRTTTNWDDMVDKWNSTWPQNGWELHFSGPGYGPSGQVWFTRFAGSWNDNAISTQVLTEGRWYHIVGTYDGTDMKIYIDGVLKDTHASSLSMDPVAEPLTIGTDTGGNAYQGGLADVAVYSYALTATQITAHYNARN